MPVGSRRLVFLALVYAAAKGLSAQVPARTSLPLRHRMFIHWGYNRSWFTGSDIRFSGDDYSFTLRDVSAHDRPEPFDLSLYFKPATMWIPQYNYRAGFFLTDRWSLSLGLDHMKYVVDAGQTVHMDGYARTTGTGEWDPNASAQDVALTADFLQYEHTDGLNLLSFDADHYTALWTSTDTTRALHVFEGAFLGPVIPRTDVRLQGEGINNNFHLSGWGAGAQLGVHFTFCRHFYLRTVVKGGYIDLPDVLTTGSDPDRASQHFWFVQWNAVAGATIGFGKK
jgi:hypothetical protein